MSTIVALAKCDSYNSSEVEFAVNRALSCIGGINRFVSAGHTVLIKPNLLSGRHPDCAITTHPEVVRALIHLVKAAGATPVVADSAANMNKMSDVWEKTGFADLCAQESVSLVNLEHAGAKGFDVDGMRFSVAKPVLDADLVINVPKLKTHVLTVLTNAVKNIYGTMPGYQKTMLHKKHAQPDQFGRFLAVLYSRVKPALTLCDAVVGMEGSGPAGGDPVKLGFISASEDGVALDVVMCRLLGIDIKAVPYFKWLKNMGVGEVDPDEIVLAGDQKDFIALPSLRLPSVWIKRMMPDWLVAMIRPFVWIRASFTEQCSSCGLCVKACPVSALSIEKNRRPELKAELCIECCCCHEVCPCKAVRMMPSPLLSLFMRRRFKEE